MSKLTILHESIVSHFPELSDKCVIANKEITLTVPADQIYSVCLQLRDGEQFSFEQLIDLCGVDYLTYGSTEWETETATSTGFDRSANRENQESTWQGTRFAVVYHLLSIRHNVRLRLRAFVEGEPPIIDSVMDIWRVADWYEREAFDLFGILFKGHPDLRRILTDYGFVGHPFRKDFPMIGEVEMRYDATQERIVYEPVSIEPRILVPKVIRREHEAALVTSPVEEEKA